MIFIPHTKYKRKKIIWIILIIILCLTILFIVNRVQENKDIERVIVCLFITCESYDPEYVDYNFNSHNCSCYIYDNSTGELFLNKTKLIK